MPLFILKSKDSMTPGKPVNHTQEPLPYKAQLKHGLCVLLLKISSLYKTGLQSAKRITLKNEDTDTLYLIIALTDG